MNRIFFLFQKTVKLFIYVFLCGLIYFLLGFLFVCLFVFIEGQYFVEILLTRLGNSFLASAKLARRFESHDILIL